MSLTPKSSILTINPYKPGLSKANSNLPIIKLSSNETPLGASSKAIEAYGSAAKSLFRYPDGSATVLREAIGQVHGLNPDRIICGAGSDEIIAFLCHAYAGSGDEVLYTQHGFLMYEIYTKIAGATPVVAPEKNLRTDVDSLLAAVSSKTKIVFIANPNNPTGSYIPKSELHRLRSGLRDDILLVIDDAYAEYVSEDDYSSGVELVDIGENTVMTRTFSKIYGLASLRIGWAYCPESVVDVLNRVRGPFNVSSPAIFAATAAVKDVEFTKSAKEHNDKWLPWLTMQMEDAGLKVYPSVGNFILVEFPDGNKNANTANDYLMEKGIIGRKVDGYGLPKCLRFTIGLEVENIALSDAIKDFMSDSLLK
jgi:histidinol-phosphate aminotransferase